MLIRHRNQVFLAVFLLLALAMAGGCAATASRPANTASSGEQIAARALAMNGKPYRYGGSGPSGFDCSGLVHFAHREAGISVPRTTESQFRQARPVSPTALQPGDLLFFRIAGKVSHVGLYAGDGRFVHAPSSGKRVEVVALDHPYWRRQLVGTGRLH
ncbi:MAG TPA: C40 family peptidase [Gammaproteobacteria bacterium]|nr:C40 family peptidase [Gammaproteobacteria bacterium]